MKSNIYIKNIKEMHCKKDLAHGSGVWFCRGY